MAELKKNVVLDFQLAEPVAPPQTNTGSTLGDLTGLLKFGADLFQRQENIRVKRETGRIADEAFTIFADTLEQGGDFNRALLNAQRLISKKSDPVAISEANQAFLARIQGFGSSRGSGSKKEGKDLFEQLLGNNDARATFISQAIPELSEDPNLKKFEAVARRMNPEEIKQIPELRDFLNLQASEMQIQQGMMRLEEQRLNGSNQQQRIGATRTMNVFGDRISDLIRFNLGNLVKDIDLTGGLSQQQIEDLDKKLTVGAKSLKQVIDSTADDLLARVTDENAAKIIEDRRAALKAQIDEQLSLFDGKENLESTVRVLKAVQTESGIEFSKAFPVLMGMKEGLSDSAFGFVVKTTMLEGGTLKKLKDVFEGSGVTDPAQLRDFGKKIALLASGEVLPEDLDPNSPVDLQAYASAWNANKARVVSTNAFDDPEDMKRTFAGFVAFASNAKASGDEKLLKEVHKIADNATFRQNLERLPKTDREVVASTVASTLAESIGGDAGLFKGKMRQFVKYNAQSGRFVFDEKAFNKIRKTLSAAPVPVGAGERASAASLGVSVSVSGQQAKRLVEQANRLVKTMEYYVEVLPAFKEVDKTEAAKKLLGSTMLLQGTISVEGIQKEEAQTLKEAIDENKPLVEIEKEKSARQRVQETTSDVVSMATQLAEVAAQFDDQPEVLSNILGITEKQLKNGVKGSEALNLALKQALEEMKKKKNG
jgi:hypothetical protein